MSAPHIILDNLPSLRQNCRIWWKFDVVITKIFLLVFWDMVYSRNINTHVIVVQTQQPAAISQNATKVELIETTEQITSLSVCRIK